MKLSILIPLSKKETNFDLFFSHVKNTLAKKLAPHEYEIIFINDSADSSLWNSIKNICLNYETIKAVNLTRNFGLIAAYSAGCHYASGDILIFLDQDGSHLSILEKAIEKWQLGFPCILSQKISHKQLLLERLRTWIYQKLLLFHSDFNKNIFFSFLESCILIEKQELSQFKNNDSNQVFVLHTFLKEGKYTTITVSGTKKQKRAFDNIIIFGSCLLVSFIAQRISFFLKVLMILSTFLTCSMILVQIGFLWLIRQYILRIREQYEQTPLYLVKNITINNEVSPNKKEENLYNPYPLKEQNATQ